jgi:hypothetical protein
MKIRLAVAALALSIAAGTASAACMNRFVVRTDGNQQVVTLLTGKLTFQEAQELAKKIGDGQSPGLEWINDSGKTISRQNGELKVVRPMPVGCDSKPSGVVIIARFLAVQPPSKKMNVKLDANTTVAFDEQP